MTALHVSRQIAGNAGGSTLWLARPARNAILPPPALSVLTARPFHAPPHPHASRAHERTSWRGTAPPKPKDSSPELSQMQGWAGRGVGAGCGGLRRVPVVVLTPALSSTVERHCWGSPTNPKWVKRLEESSASSRQTMGRGTVCGGVRLLRRYSTAATSQLHPKVRATANAAARRPAPSHARCHRDGTGGPSTRLPPACDSCRLYPRYERA